MAEWVVSCGASLAFGTNGHNLELRFCWIWVSFQSFEGECRAMDVVSIHHYRCYYGKNAEHRVNRMDQEGHTFTHLPRYLMRAKRRHGRICSGPSVLSWRWASAGRCVGIYSLLLINIPGNWTKAIHPPYWSHTRCHAIQGAAATQ